MPPEIEIEIGKWKIAKCNEPAPGLGSARVSRAGESVPLRGLSKLFWRRRQTLARRHATALQFKATFAVSR